MKELSRIDAIRICQEPVGRRNHHLLELLPPLLNKMNFLPSPVDSNKESYIFPRKIFSKKPVSLA